MFKFSKKNYLDQYFGALKKETHTHILKTKAHPGLEVDETKFTTDKSWFIFSFLPFTSAYHPTLFWI